jgi:hypothetical protein
MAELKYEKYFIQGHDWQKYFPKGKGRSTAAVRATGEKFKGIETPLLHHVLSINNMLIEGSIMMNCSWLFAGEDPGVMGAHTHPYPEIIGFIGSNKDDLYDLGAEAEIWMDDEKYIITNSFLVYVPTGLKHCPLTVRNIKSNVFHFDLQLTTGDFTAAPTG